MKAFYLVLTAMFFLSCHEERKNENFFNDHPVLNESIANTRCARFTRDAGGNLVLSFVKEINDSIAYLCYSVSEDEGKTFSDPVEIKETYNVHPHGENLPKIIFKPDGRIIAMWGVSNPNPNSKYSGLVYYTQSFNEGKTWSPAISLVKDTSAYDQRYFDMAVLPNGEVMAVWLDNRGEKKKEGSTLFCAVTSGETGFSGEKAIAETCCPCCRTDLYVDAERFVHVVFRDIINDSIRDMAHLISDDNGKSFSQPIRISADNWVIDGCPHTGPAITESNGSLHFAWYTLGGEGGLFYCSSKDNGRTFSQRETVSALHSAKHPQILSVPGGNILIAWDEFDKEDKMGSNYIKVQLRSPDGKTLFTKTVSMPGEKCEFPAVTTIDEHIVIISYTRRRNDMSQVVWKHLNLKSETDK